MADDIQQADPSTTAPAPSTTATPAPAGGPSDFDTALDTVTSQMQGQLDQQSQTEAAGENVGQKALDVAGGFAGGATKGVVDTLNFASGLVHGPQIKPMQTPILSTIYSQTADMDRESGLNGFADGVGQFAVGLLGVGKVFDALKIGELAAKAGTVGKVVGEVAKGFGAAYVALDPHQQRLSDLIQSVPQLRNPINAFLASNPDDPDALGRLKNAIEGAGVDVAATAVLSAAVKTFKIAGAVAKGLLPKAELDKATTELNNVVQSAHPADSPANDLASQTTQGGQLDQSQAPVNVKATPSPDADIVPGENKVNPQTGVADITVHGGAKPAVDEPVAPATDEEGQPNPAAKVAPIAAPADDATQTVQTVVNATKASGDLKGRVSQDTIQQAISAAPGLADAPKTSANGITFRVISDDDMEALGKPLGVDTKGVLAAAHDGQIVVTQAVLDKSPAEQARILSHELGHILQPDFDRSLARAGAEEPPKQELIAASRALRPEHYASAKAKAGTPEGKQMLQYLGQRKELFADAFSLWKTDPKQMAKVAPQTAKLFDEHFSAWRDTDLTTLAPNTALARKQGMVGKPIAAAVKDVPDQMAAPETFTPRMTFDQVDAQAILDRYNTDTAALAQYGSRDAAAQAGYKFGQANLPWQKLRGADDFVTFHDSLASDFKQTLDQMKGGDALHDKRVDDMVTNLVKLFNADPSEVLGQIKAMGHNANALVANMEASLVIANKAGDDLFALVKQIKAGNLTEFGGDREAALHAIGQRMSLFVESMGSAQSMRAALGRGMRRLQGKFQVDPKILASVQKFTPEQLMNLVDLSGGDPKLMADMVNRGFWNRAFNAIGTWYANNLLWLWPTHLRNTVGNVFMLSATPAMRAVGSFAMGSAGRDVRTMALREYRYMLSAVGDASSASIEAYLRGDSLLNSHSNEFFRRAGDNLPTTAAGKIGVSSGFRPMSSIGDVLYNGFQGLNFGVTQPTRLLGMADEFIKQMSYRGSVLSKASLDADKLGLSGKDYQDYLQNALSNSMDGDGKALDADALYDAQVRTFQQPLLDGTFGKEIIQNATTKFPVMRLVLPFVRTPINLVRYAWKLTPGLNLLSKEYRQMLSGSLGPQRQADAYGQMVLGATSAASLMGMANAGMITGGAPVTPGDAKALQDTGWRPYSFVSTNADGSHTYLPFNQIDPIGMLFGIIADTHQIIQQGQVSDQGIDKLVLPVVMAIAHNITSRTYLQSLSQTIDAISDPDQSMPKMVGSVASGLVPFSSLLREVDPDPYTRDARGIVDGVMANLPGFSQSLPPRRDPFGAPISRVNNVVFGDKASDVVDQEQQRMLTNYGVGVTPPSPMVNGGVDLRTITLPDGSNAFDKYQQTAADPKGAPSDIKTALGKLITSDEYQKLPDGDGTLKGTKLYALNDVVRHYRESALKQLQSQYPTLAQQMGARQQAVREAVRNAQSNQDGAGNVVNGFISRALKATNSAFGLNTIPSSNP